MGNVRRHVVLGTVILCGFLGGWPSGAFGEETQRRESRIAQVELALKHAAKKSPRWHSHQASIQRDVHDITYFIEQAMKTPDSDSVKQYAREAMFLLQRALDRGHFHPGDVAPILSEIQQLIPDRSL